MENEIKPKGNKKPIIEVRGIGKKYDIKHMRGGYVALRDVLANIAKSPFSFLKNKAKQAVGLEKKEEFWALKDVSFTVERGEVIGVIGPNGAGKSTLLKILSQITPPTEGEIVLRGRVGSLLEVGTGFHPELTGRENIFLNGAILGMKKKEIEKKFDEIVEFAGIEKFLDTPVKKYSSGMYVRLAFSVAAHMEPDILLVDEVLAVGDTEFQKKCLGKMDEITRSEGRTILFVSHNLGAIQQLCSRAILLKKGQVVFHGKTQDTINFYNKDYTDNNQDIDIKNNLQRRGDGKIRFTDFYIEDKDNNKIISVKNGSDIKFIISYECKHPDEIKNIDMGISIHKNGVMVSKIYNSYINQQLTNIKKEGRIIFETKNIPFALGKYEIRGRILADGIESDWLQVPLGVINVTESVTYIKNNLSNEPELTVILDGNWSIE